MREVRRENRGRTKLVGSTRPDDKLTWKNNRRAQVLKWLETYPTDTWIPLPKAKMRGRQLERRLAVLHEMSEAGLDIKFESTVACHNKHRKAQIWIGADAVREVYPTVRCSSTRCHARFKQLWGEKKCPRCVAASKKYRAGRYARCVAVGICGICWTRRIDAGVGSVCKVCKDRIARLAARRGARRQAAGQCKHCGRVLPEGWTFSTGRKKAWCQSCLAERSRQYDYRAASWEVFCVSCLRTSREVSWSHKISFCQRCMSRVRRWGQCGKCGAGLLKKGCPTCALVVT